MEGGWSCIKYILFVFNFIFVVFGGLLVYLGVIILQDDASWQALLNLSPNPTSLAISIIVLGCLIFLVAFLGCCGAIVESHCILLTFGIVVTVIFFLELAIGGLAFTFKTELRSFASPNVVTKYNWSDTSARYSDLIDSIQSKFKCCGFNSSADWRDFNPNPADRNILPASCCSSESGGYSPPNSCRLPESLPSSLPNYGNSGISGNQPFESPSSTSLPLQSSPKVYDQNCADVFYSIMYANLGPLGLALLAVALFQLLGIIFAFSLSRAVKREYQVV